ncbi:MAG: B12-binding domain-containing radical SAM protein [Desulfobacterium sp.]|nr:B12-binding domain-containing radical SAM protein [Desulfobacterium sp.]
MSSPIVPVKKPHIICVNPWIHDFAAYDVWAKPLGLLLLAAILREQGYSVSYIDCLDRFHPRSPLRQDPYARNGRGPYLKTHIQKPHGLADIPRNYSCYGIMESWFREDLKAQKKPDLILITSLMTYWYPGVQQTIRVIRDVFPDVPVILGGIYATLCQQHAEITSGADKVVTGSCDQEIVTIIEKETGGGTRPVHPAKNMDELPFPALDLLHTVSYIPILTARGCPFSCSYCASGYLSKQYVRRSPERVVDEILYWHQKYRVRDFVFYDDALLIDAENHALPILEAIIQADLDIRFHTPNALHIREMSNDIIRLLYRAGFFTIRLGLETTSFEDRKSLDQKFTEQEFHRAVLSLQQAGFEKGQIGAYLLVGLPGQSVRDIEQSIQVVKQNKIRPVLAYFTPIPHTKIWSRAVESSRYDIESDPIFTNNAILPCMDHFSWSTLTRLKNLASGC